LPAIVEGTLIVDYVSGRASMALASWSPDALSAHFPLHEGSGSPIRSHEARGIENPAIDQLFQTPLGVVVEHSRAAKGVKVAIGIEAQLGGAMVSMDQLLASVAERLEVADGVGMLQSGHE
jgi:hypothetical protein